MVASTRLERVASSKHTLLQFAQRIDFEQELLLLAFLQIIRLGCLAGPVGSCAVHDKDVLGAFNLAQKDGHHLVLLVSERYTPLGISTLCVSVLFVFEDFGHKLPSIVSKDQVIAPGRRQGNANYALGSPRLKG